MKTSARNCLQGTVAAIRGGAVNDEIELALRGGARIVATVTHESTEALGLKPGVDAFALIKASSVIVATDLRDVRLSARNSLEGKVRSVTPGAVNGEIVIEIPGGDSIVAIVTQSSVASLGLAPGSDATALFKASSVLLGAKRV